jgi:hypothetical protein
MSKKLKVQGESDLERDASTGAIVNTNQKSFAQFQQRKAAIKAKDNELLSLRAEVDELRGMIESIINSSNKPKTQKSAK